MADKTAAKAEKKTAAKKTARARKASEPKAPKATPATPRSTEPDPLAVHATAAEAQAVRDGDAKADPKKPAPRPRSVAPLPVAPAEEREQPVQVLAAVVPVTAENRAKKGFRVETVVATRQGYYGNARRRAGSVFQIGLVGPGYLPSWVKLANTEDQDPVVSRSRQVVRNSTGEEIRADVERDAGTEVPTYLGGGQRLAHSSSGDVL